MTPNQVVSMLVDHGVQILMADYEQVTALAVFWDRDKFECVEQPHTFYPDIQGQFDHGKVSAWLGY